MKLTYTPEDGEPQVWSFSADKLMTTEAEAVEKVTGMSYDEFGTALVRGRATAKRAVVWVLRKRSEPTLRYSAVDFPMGALAVELDVDELLAIRRAAVDGLPGVSDEDVATALVDIDRRIIAQGGDPGQATPGNGLVPSGSGAAGS